MKKLIRILSLVLALLMLASCFVACDGDEGKGDDTTVSTNPGDDKALPALDWDGAEYRILGRQHETLNFQNFEVSRDEMSDDVVGKAVWERNNKLTEKYNFVVNGILEKDPAARFKTAAGSGEDLYDLVIAPNGNFNTWALEGYLLDMAKLDYINFEHDTWNKNSLKELTIGGRVYYGTSNFLLQDKHRTYITMINRDYIKDNNLEDIESLVLDGKWTIEKAVEIYKQGAKESDGQDGLTNNDNWGFTSLGTDTVLALMVGAGFRASEIGSDGYPKLTGATDQMMSIIDKVFTITNDQTFYYCDSQHTAPATQEETSEFKIFYAGKAVAMEMCVSVVNAKKHYSFDASIIPNPKFDEDQDLYISPAQWGLASLFAIPSASLDPSRAAFFLQAISEEAHTTSYPAYIESKCKLQDTIDEVAADCIALVFEGISYDIALINNIGNIKTVILDQVASSANNNYNQRFSRLESQAKKQIENIKNVYATLEY